MTVSQNQRLRKAAAKAAKRKATVAEKKAQDRRELSISKPRHIDFAASPIRACLVNRNGLQTGTATVMVARNLSNGRVGVAVFLADLFCRGVKDVFFRVLPAVDFEDMRRNFDDRNPLMPIEPSVARRLLRGAVEYAASIGLPPTPDFAEIEPIFGDTPLADETFNYGKNGKPLYMPGPNEGPRTVKRVLNTLREKLGEDGFEYVVAFDDFDVEEEDEAQSEGIEGEVLDDKAA